MGIEGRDKRNFDKSGPSEFTLDRFPDLARPLVKTNYCGFVWEARLVHQPCQPW